MVSKTVLLYIKTCSGFVFICGHTLLYIMCVMIIMMKSVEMVN